MIDQLLTASLFIYLVVTYLFGSYLLSVEDEEEISDEAFPVSRTLLSGSSAQDSGIHLSSEVGISKGASE